MTSRMISGGGGTRLYVQDGGNPHGRPLFFLHGFSQSSRCWSRQMVSPLAQTYRLVAMDLRGHGMSDKPRDAYGDGSLWAKDIQAVIEELALDHPVMIVWSYGGYILCDYLTIYGEQFLGGINLVGAATKMGSPDANALLAPEFLALVPSLLSEDIKTSVEALTSFIHLVAPSALSERDFYEWLGYNAVVPSHVRRSLFARKLDFDALLAALTLPTMITHGQHDRVVLVETAYRYQSLIAHAQMDLYPETGHAPFFEQSDRFNRALMRFAESL